MLVTSVSRYYATKVRVPTEIETFEITTLDGVEQMTKLFGSTFGIGLRTPFLSVCKRETQLQSRDTVNILDVAHKRNGMKFRYDYAIGSLNVCIIYSNMTVPAVVTDDMNHLPQLSLLPQPQVFAQNWEEVNIIGADFEF